jgi:hypothetical protein
MRTDLDRCWIDPGVTTFADGLTWCAEVWEGRVSYYQGAGSEERWAKPVPGREYVDPVPCSVEP